jgi:hypothetical protein
METCCKACGIPISEMKEDFNEDYELCGPCWRLIQRKQLDESISGETEVRPANRGLLRG